MALQVLREQGRVLPVSGRLCKPCFLRFSENTAANNQKEGSVITGNESLIANNPVITSPFIPPVMEAEANIDDPKSSTTIPMELNVPVQDASDPLLTLKTEVTEEEDDESQAVQSDQSDIQGEY